MGFSKLFMAEGKLRRNWLLLAILAVITAIMGALVPMFLSPFNFTLLSQKIVEIGLLGLAITIGLIAGLLDLSLGSILGLSAVVLGLLAESGVSLWLCIVIALIVGMSAGMINGVLAAFTPFPPLIITISTQFIFYGIALALTNGTPITELPANYAVIGQTELGAFPLQLIFLLIILAFLLVLMNRSGLGRKFRMMGKSERVARMTGMNVRALKITVYALLGVLAAIAGIVLTSRVMTIRPDAGQTLGWTIVTIAFLSGASLQGGSGTVFGAVLGAAILVFITSGVQIGGIEVGGRLAIQGGVMILVAGGNAFLQTSD